MLKSEKTNESLTEDHLNLLENKLKDLKGSNL